VNVGCFIDGTPKGLEGGNGIIGLPIIGLSIVDQKRAAKKKQKNIAEIDWMKLLFQILLMSLKWTLN